MKRLKFSRRYALVDEEEYRRLMSLKEKQRSAAATAVVPGAPSSEELLREMRVNANTESSGEDTKAMQHARLMRRYLSEIERRPVAPRKETLAKSVSFASRIPTPFVDEESRLLGKLETSRRDSAAQERRDREELRRIVREKRRGAYVSPYAASTLRYYDDEGELKTVGSPSKLSFMSEKPRATARGASRRRRLPPTPRETTDRSPYRTRERTTAGRKRVPESAADGDRERWVTMSKRQY